MLLELGREEITELFSNEEKLKGKINEAMGLLQRNEEPEEKENPN